MHKMTANQKLIASKILHHLHSHPWELRTKQADIAMSADLTQGQISRHLKTLVYYGIVERDHDAYVVGPKASKYLAAWCVEFSDDLDV